MIRRPPRSTLFPTRRSSDLVLEGDLAADLGQAPRAVHDLDRSVEQLEDAAQRDSSGEDRKSTRLNSSHRTISYAVFCLKKKKYTHGKHFFSLYHQSSLCTAL